MSCCSLTFHFSLIFSSLAGAVCQWGRLSQVSEVNFIASFTFFHIHSLPAFSSNRLPLAYYWYVCILSNLTSNLYHPPLPGDCLWHSGAVPSPLKAERRHLPLSHSSSSPNPSRDPSQKLLFAGLTQVSDLAFQKKSWTYYGIVSTNAHHFLSSYSKKQCNNKCIQAEFVASESALGEKAWALQQSKNYRFQTFCLLPILGSNINYHDVAVLQWQP